MSLLALNSLPAERMRGCVFAERFENEALVEHNGGEIFGTPVIDFGAKLNGTTDYIKYLLSGEFNSAELAIHLEFYPDFATDEDARRYIFSTTAFNYHLVKFENVQTNQLRLYLGGTSIAVIAEATYAPYWVVGGRNLITVSGTSGATDIWFNGVQIVTADPSVWNPTNDAALEVGRFFGGGNYFDGIVSRFYVGHHLTDFAEHTAIYENTMWDWETRATVNLQFRTRDFDPTNVRTLDSSGHGNHATLGDGSTPATYPTQGRGRMGFDDIAYLSGIANPTGSFTVLITQAMAGAGSVIERWATYAHNDLTIWTPIFTSGGFAGEVAGIVVVPEILNATQILDHHSRAMRRIGTQI